MRPKFSILTMTVLAGISLAGCNPEELASPVIGCSTGTAQIIVRDGALQRLCGCAETDTTLVVPPAQLTCSVAAGTVLFFQYIGTRVSHQIVSSGTPSFPNSPVSDPNAIGSTRVHAVSLTVPGTYAFYDILASTVMGQISVF